MQHLFKFVLLIGAFIVSSCEKERNGMDEMKDKAKLNFINVAPYKAASLNNVHSSVWFYFNGKTPFGQGLRTGIYSGYRALDPGVIETKIEVSPGSAGGNPPNLTPVQQKQISLTLERDAYYTLFAVDSAEKVDTLFYQDDLSLPNAGKIKVRILNLSSDVDTMDVYDASTNKTLALSLARKGRSPFIEIDPVDLTSLRVKNVRTGTVYSPIRVNGTNRLLWEAGNIYTLFFYGFVSRSGVAALQYDYFANRFTFTY